MRTIPEYPDGMECRHLDGNPANNHSDNLRWNTHMVNIRDRNLHGTTNEGSRNGHAKLTEQQVRQIVYIHRTELFTQEEIGGQFGISGVTVCEIVNKKKWKCLWTA
ncbi:hypothetical protein LCGC14_0873460 [marine sediment metagenome]|uniref:HNH nuclease domain-containing protein n=1 Tax=marine sediment metagenome TaxID=412755 RepID=A0A0F9SB24_9ZZZZ